MANKMSWSLLTDLCVTYHMLQGTVADHMGSEKLICQHWMESHITKTENVTFE